MDQNNDGDVDRFDGDSINGSDITASYPGDTVTIRVGNTNITYRGTTFYLANGQRVFTPTDGQVLQNGLFRSSTFVQTQGPMQVPVAARADLLHAGRADPDARRRAPGGDAAAGDLVTTRDRGAQPGWSGPGAETVPGTGDTAPVADPGGRDGEPARLLVSPQHRMRGARLAGRAVTRAFPRRWWRRCTS